MRKTEFANGEFYHIYNRGTDKRTIFEEEADMFRFFESMQDFNVEDPIGSIYEYSLLKKQFGGATFQIEKRKPLVQFIAYCLNPNHFHFLLEQVADDGIPKFMHRLSTGYTKYFNKKYHRTGVLFSGRYKAIHVDSNEYLLRLSAYVNLNNLVHHLEVSQTGLPIFSSWDEYKNEKTSKGICDTTIIAEQFSKREEYLDFANDALMQIIANKESKKEIENLLFE